MTQPLFKGRISRAVLKMEGEPGLCPLLAQSGRRRSLARFLESQRHWLRHRGQQFCSITVRENPGIVGLGEHAHQLVHVPPALQKDFLAHVRNFLRAGRQHRRQCLKASARYSNGAVAYCKGSTASGRQLLMDRQKGEFERLRFSEVIATKGYQGKIWGKRLYISRALCAKAQRLHSIKDVSWAA